MNKLLNDKFDLEQCKNRLSIIDVNNPFLNLNKPTVNDIKNLLNHNIWIRIKDTDNVMEHVCKVIGINDDYIL